MVNYTAQYKCKNCTTVNWITTEKGQSLKDKIIEDKIVCRECGVSLVEEKDE